MIKFGVISFPGTNCEHENVRAFKRSGMDAEIVLWNDPKMLDGSRLDEFDGYCIAGGFCYEDRGRSGVVAAQDPITDVLRAEAKKGKVVLGICNGAQVLVETGLIPGFDNNEVAIGLAWNEMKKDDELVGTGFYNIWSHLKNVAPKPRSAFNNFSSLMFIPIAHGEGRFVMEEKVLKKLEEEDQIIFKYADSKGNVSPDFPITPNGSMESIAAICNPAGNVMAIMPHPERDPHGNGDAMFESIRDWIEDKKSVDSKPLGHYKAPKSEELMPTYDLEILVRMIITDNAERTIQSTLERKGFSVTLERYLHYGINLKKDVDPKKALQKIVHSGELANLNKEKIFAITPEEEYVVSKEGRLSKSDFELEHYVIARDKDDFVGESKLEALKRHAGDMIESIDFGVLWHFTESDDSAMHKVIESHVLHNPISMKVLTSV